jgi:hypothetical protein
LGVRVWPILAVAVFVGSCSAPQQRATDKENVVFTFSSGPCPAYTVEIFEDLRARFTGSRDTHEHGVAWFQVTPEQLEALRAAKLPYWAKKLLAGGCGYDVTHCLRVERKWDSKWVGTCLCEQEIAGFEAELLSISGVGAWAAADRECPEPGGAAGL